MRSFARLVSNAYAFIVSLLPWAFNDYFARFFAWLWVDALQIRKKVVYANIDIAFPGTPEETKKKWMRKSIYVLGRGAVDLGRVPYVTDEWANENVIFHGLENVPKDQGFFFLTLHLGGADLAAAVTSEKVVPLSLISKRFTNTFVDEFWFYLRTKSKTQIIDAHSKNNAFEILKALRLKRAVIFVLDQFMGKPYGIETEFFGKKTGTAYGLALFALKTKAPVLPLYTYWDDNKRLHVGMGKPILIDDVDTSDKLEAQRIITNRFNATLENIIRQYPDQWMWVHRRWKDFE
ncbi:lipid A biosynthesis lauroyl acyltransferase [Bdellovibrio sp. qaytius]|nr:lipid A biosynthesis lauroyl acyltransferase [Bdellovibrio sp. qaytius]